MVDVSGSRNGRENNHGLLRMINPRIIDRSGSAIMREGCMSVPDYTGDVERSTEVRVSFLEPEGSSGRLPPVASRRSPCSTR